MEADFSVELGPDDEVLEFPWADPESRLRYYDLKHQPELLLELEESRQFPELGEFLAAINSPACKLESAKCDAWFTTELHPEDEIFGATGKFGSYVDLIFSGPERLLFSEHEKLAQQLINLLKRVPEIPAAAELLIRRCYYHGGNETTDGLLFHLLPFRIWRRCRTIPPTLGYRIGPGGERHSAVVDAVKACGYLVSAARYNRRGCGTIAVNVARKYRYRICAVAVFARVRRTDLAAKAQRLR